MIKDYHLHGFRKIVATSVVISLFLSMTGLLSAQRPEPEVYGTFDGDDMYTVLPPGTIPAIEKPVFLQGIEASDQMLPNEPVIGVIIEGEARAYSMWHLDAHEIVNDRINGRAIAVTW